MEKKFLQVISEHQGIIVKVCSLYCSDPEEAEDLFQEITLELWRSYTSFKEEAKITTWMYRLALNVAITRLRKRKNNKTILPFSDARHDVPEAPNQRLDLEYEQALSQAISRLNRFDKALITLYLDEKSYEEMAEIMGISETYIGVKLNRIKKKLKELLKPES